MQYDEAREKRGKKTMKGKARTARNGWRVYLKPRFTALESHPLDILAVDCDSAPFTLAHHTYIYVHVNHKLSHFVAILYLIFFLSSTSLMSYGGLDFFGMQLLSYFWIVYNFANKDWDISEVVLFYSYYITIFFFSNHDLVMLKSLLKYMQRILRISAF